MIYLTKSERALLRTSHNETVSISFRSISGDGSAVTITEKHLLQGGLSVNRYSASGKGIELGCVSAAELTLRLNNSEGQWNSTVFEGGELAVTLGIPKEDGATLVIPLGHFTVDEAPRKLAVITLTALDGMVLFDREVNPTLLTFPMTAETLVSRLCAICGVTLATTGMSGFPNHDYIIESAPIATGTTYTWRQYLSWAAQLMGVCGYMDENGHLALGWYTDCGETVAPADRFTSDLYEQAVVVTGVQVTDTAKNVYLKGSSGYVVNVSGNPFVTHDVQTVAEALYGHLGGFTYTPFSATTIPMPHLWPLDVVTFTDSQGVSHRTIITDTTFTVNRNTKLAGKGETSVKKGWASADPLTRREQIIIEELKRAQNEAQNAQTQATLDLNRLISNSLGLYFTAETVADGSTVYYMHDKETLAESQTIYTMTATGIAWTDAGWNDGDPVWQSGVTAAGDALFRRLSAEGVTVSKEGESYHIEMTPKAFSIYCEQMLATRIEGDEMEIPKLKVTSRALMGKTQAVPYEKDGAVLGTNILFID